MVSSSLPVDLIWQAELEEPLSARPTLTTKVIITQTSVALYGLDKNSGQPLWKYPFSRRQPSSTPVIAEGDLVVFGEYDGIVTALDAVSGRIIWQRQHCGKEYSIESIISDHDRVYVASQPTAIEALNLDNGSISWSHCEINSTVFPSRGAKLFIGEDEKLYVVTTEVHILNLDNGFIEQEFEENLSGVQQLVNERFYGKNWVRDAKTMRIINTLTSPSYIPLHGDCDDFEPPFIFGSDHIYAVGNCGGIFSLDLENFEVSESSLSNLYVLGSVTIYKDMLYALTSNGEIHALDPVFGSSAGILRTNQNVGASIALSYGSISDNEILIITFGDREMYAFKE